MRILSKLILVSIFVAPQPALADPCSNLFAQLSGKNVGLQMTTMSAATGVVSYVTGGLNYQESIRTQSGAVRPGGWRTVSGAPAQQYFSDRSMPNTPNQRFSFFRSDDVTLHITEQAAPQISITFVDQGNSTLSFVGSCSQGNVIHGSQPSMDILIVLSPPLG